MRILAMIVFSCLFLASCETLKGAGNDIHNAGDALDNVVNDE